MGRFTGNGWCLEVDEDVGGRLAVKDSRKGMIKGLGASSNRCGNFAVIESAVVLSSTGKLHRSRSSSAMDVLAMIRPLISFLLLLD